MTNPSNRLFDEWTSQVRDLATFSEIVTLLSAGQRLDVLKAMFDSVDDDEKRRLSAWISDHYGPVAALRNALLNFGKKDKK